MADASVERADLDRLRVISISHRTTSLEVLERVALSPADAVELRRRLRAAGVEAIPLSTCHRSELYWGSGGPAQDGLAESALCVRDGNGREIPAESICRLSGENVARHLLRVAAGLEAVIIGEAEILGQVRAALEAATTVGRLEPALAELFRDALRFGRLARARTRIGAGALSLASAAVQLIRLAHPDLSRCNVAVVGAGTLGTKIVRHLRAERIGRCLLLNRTLARAEVTAQANAAEAAPLSALQRALGEADAMVVAVHTDQPLVTAEAVRTSRETSPGTPLVIIDASMPRAVDPTTANLPGVRLTDLSGLEALVAENRADREAEIPRVEALLEEALLARARRQARRLAWGGGQHASRARENSGDAA